MLSIVPTSALLRVPPPDPLLEQAHVVVRAADPDGEQRGTRRDEPVGYLRRRGGHPDGARDLAWVPADVGAVAVEDPILAGERVQVAEAVPNGGVLCGVAQRLAFPSAADEDRDVACRSGVQLRPSAADAGECLRQVGEPRAGRAEVVAVLVVVALEPTCADAEDEPAPADVVDGAGHVGQQLGVAIAVARDERADLDAAGGLGPGAQHCPALEVFAVGLAVKWKEVVPVEHDVHAGLLGLRDGRADLRVVGVLGLELETDPDEVRHVPDPVTGVGQPPGKDLGLVRRAPSATRGFRDRSVASRVVGGWLARCGDGFSHACQGRRWRRTRSV